MIDHIKFQEYRCEYFLLMKASESEFNEFERHLKSAKNRFQLSAGLNLVKLNTILSGTNTILAASQI